MFPKMLTYVSDSIFFPKDFYFFVNILEDLIKQRHHSTDVLTMNLKFRCSNFKEFF